MKNETVAIYLRSAVFNTSEIKEHRKRCEDYATARDWKVGSVFVDNGRGGIQDRPGLIELRRCIAEGLISIVLTPKLSHIAWEVTLYEEFLLLCNTYNVKIVFMNTNSADTLSPRGNMASVIFEAYNKMRVAERRRKINKKI